MSDIPEPLVQGKLGKSTLEFSAAEEEILFAYYQHL